MMILILLVFCLAGSMGTSLFGGPPTPGRVGDSSRVIRFYYNTPNTDNCWVSGTCFVTFYRDGTKIDVNNKAKYSLAKLSGSDNGYCPVTSNSLTRMKKMLRATGAGNGKMVLVKSSPEKCVVLELTIKDIALSDFSRNYSCTIFHYTNLRVNGIVFYNEDVETVNKKDPSIVYYKAPTGEQYIQQYSSSEVYLLYYCVFYGTVSVQWRISTGNSSFVEIANGDYWRSFEIYDKFTADETIVETVLLIRGNLGVMPIHLYCTDTASDNSKSKVFTIQQRSKKPHFDQELGFFIWLIPTVIVPPFMVVVVAVFGAVACVRGQVCTCCRRGAQRTQFNM